MSDFAPNSSCRRRGRAFPPWHLTLSAEISVTDHMPLGVSAGVCYRRCPCAGQGSALKSLVALLNILGHDVGEASGNLDKAGGARLTVIQVRGPRLMHGIYHVDPLALISHDATRFRGTSNWVSDSHLVAFASRLCSTAFPLRDMFQSPNSNPFPRRCNGFPLGATSIPDNDNCIPHNDNRFPLNDNAFPDNGNDRRVEFPVPGRSIPCKQRGIR